MGCHTTLERVVARRAKEKCTKDSDSNPSGVSRDVLDDTAIGVGESATRSRSVGLNWSTQRTIHRRNRCKETFANGQTRQRKGKVTASPKAKVKARARENIQEKENHNQDVAGSLSEETGQRTLGYFAIKRHRVEFVGDVQESDSFET